ncbi:unnamed protein product [Agarophyton chilense]
MRPPWRDLSPPHAPGRPNREASSNMRPPRSINLSLTILFLLVIVFVFLPFFLLASPPSNLTVHTTLFTDDSLLSNITTNKQQFVYFPHAALLIVSAAKSGSTSLFQFLYRGSTASSTDHAPPHCASYVQNVESACWRRQAFFLQSYTLPEQRYILTSTSVLRVAVQRNPFERLLSSFKSKFACDTELYNTNKRNRDNLVPKLRRQANLPASSTLCMNISEFATALSNLQHSNFPLHKLDVHIRPQRLYQQHIRYDIILDIADLSNLSAVQPIINRLPFGALVADGVPHRHVSGSYALLLPERAARKLYRFAAESEMAQPRFL